MEVLHLGPALFVSVVDEDDEVEEKEQDHLRALDLGTMEAMNNFDEEVEADLQIHAWMMNIEQGHQMDKLGKKVDQEGEMFVQGHYMQETIEYYTEQVRLEEGVVVAPSLHERAIHEQYLSQLDKIFTMFKLRT